VTCIVFGLPTRLDGSDNRQTPKVRRFVQRLAAEIDIPVVMQDERLSSQEAETRLAATEKDWRKRKAQLDAAAAAVILQDYLDETRQGTGQRPESGGEAE
jgi:putative holliday junction resolvase